MEKDNTTMAELLFKKIKWKKKKIDVYLKTLAFIKHCPI